MALSLADRLKQHVKVSSEYKEKNPSETIDVVVTAIRPTSKVRTIGGKDMRVMMVETKEHGQFFPLEGSVVGMQTSYGDGLPAKISVRANDYKDASGATVEGINCTGVVVNALDAAKEAAIRALPAGTALFAAF